MADTHPALSIHLSGEESSEGRYFCFRAREFEDFPAKSGLFASTFYRLSIRVVAKAAAETRQRY